MHNYRIIFVALIATMLSACTNNMKQSLGLTHAAPDEFNVTVRPSLEIPRNFTLHDPSNLSATPKRIAPSIRQDAANTLFGTHKSATRVSQGERSLLARAGVQQQRTTDIRTILLQEAQDSSDTPKSFIQNILPFAQKSRTSSLLDPIIEKERLQKEKIVKTDVQNTRRPSSI